jgi:hypothetical protein
MSEPYPCAGPMFPSQQAVAEWIEQQKWASDGHPYDFYIYMCIDGHWHAGRER